MLLAARDAYARAPLSLAVKAIFKAALAVYGFFKSAHEKGLPADMSHLTFQSCTTRKN